MASWQQSPSPPRPSPRSAGGKGKGKLPSSSTLPDHLPLALVGLSLHQPETTASLTPGMSNLSLGRPPTPSSTPTTIPLTGMGQGGMSPPTPAPSPTPKERWMYRDLGDVGQVEAVNERLEGMETMEASDDYRSGAGAGTDYTPQGGVERGRSKGKQREMVLGEWSSLPPHHQP